MVRSSRQRFALVYTALALVRILIAFTSTSIIHPDEHFQNPEIAADAVFEYDTRLGGDGPLRTWEWRGPTPARSIVPVFGSTGLAFCIVRMLCGDHWLVWRTSRSHRPTLLLLATSPITLTFLLRPFSNSLETFCLALLLYQTSQLERSRREGKILVLVGAIVAFGCFVRVTFVSFALPACVYLLRLADAFRTRRFPVVLLGRLSSMALGAAAASLACVAIDTWYFHRDTSAEAASPWLVLTPLNLLRYNLASENLKEHGLHPRYLHLLVNWPMLFGVGIVAVGTAIRSAWRQRKAHRTRPQSGSMSLYLWTLALPTLALSVQPHQEPRFLIPLLIPLVLIAGRSALGLWLTHSILFTVLFGFLHQGGLIPALFELSSSLRRTSDGQLGALREVDVVFWRTFMPPRHLLLPLSLGEAPTVRVADLAGGEQLELYQTLALLNANASDALSQGRVILVAPAYSPGIAELACSAERSAAAVATLKSTVRGSDSAAADEAAREGFLAGALSRLGLTSPAPANQDAEPARPSGPQEENTSAPPPGKSREQKRMENKRRNQRRKEARRRRREEEAKKAQQQQQQATHVNAADPVDPLGSWTSLSGASIDWSEDATSVFGSEVTVSLLSRDDAVSYASSIVLASLSPGGSTVPFSKRSTADKLAFYQSLILQFNLASQSCLPGSITKCEKVLRTIKIAIGEYFDVVKRGGNVATEVPRYKNVAQLRAALGGRKNKKRVPRKLVKSQLLAVFLVTLTPRFY
ncbi:hypothetical protein B0A53_01618 [Rhodotorula sp. CCFEE 5036]|nr:hypothetical protein B0A53_01618 [Rhodotorula sp. CCFEE 5036]